MSTGRSLPPTESNATGGGRLPVPRTPAAPESEPRNWRAPSASGIQGPRPPAPPQVPSGQLVVRIQRLEVAFQRVAKLERAVTQATQAISKLTEQVQAITEALDDVTDLAEANAKALEATVLHGAKRVHVCKSCGGKDYLAARIKCTHCGTADWWGYWPKK